MARANFARAQELYPSCDMGMDAWLKFFDSPAGTAAFGKLLYDIYDEVKAQEERENGTHKMGRRPARNAVSLDEVFGIVLPQQYTNEPFTIALKRLIGDRSQAQFAKRMFCSQSHLARLLSGERIPDLDMLETAATAAKVHPWYFLEWRAAYLSQLVAEVLLDRPHLSITAMKSVRHGRRDQETS